MNPEDRRESARLVPKQQSYVALRPDFSLLGRIIDISRGGLCFQYMAGPRGEVRQGASLEVDIFIGSNGFYLPDVPCRAVYRQTLDKPESKPGAMVYHRCGVQFADLREDQRSKVHLFLEKHVDRAQEVERSKRS